MIFKRGIFPMELNMNEIIQKMALTGRKESIDSIINKIKQEKLVNVLFKTEKDIFDFLHMEYKEPQERINEQSIILTLPLEEIKNKIEALAKEEAIEPVIKEEAVIKEEPLKELGKEDWAYDADLAEKALNVPCRFGEAEQYVNETFVIE